ncbi:TPA: amidohydrolase family protein [Legionella pneumophila]|nr:amidohydrolase family protein [Legionella pneumophila]
MNSIPHLILGDIITPTQTGQSLLIKKGYVLIDGDSIIEVGEQAHLNQEISCTVSNYPNHLILPGLIDTHSHLPQYAISGSGDLPLMDWLNALVFPAEAAFANDLKRCQRQAELFMHACLGSGTTTINTMVTSNREATEVVCDVAARMGIRAFIGLVLMDRNAPDSLVVDCDQAFKDLTFLKDNYHGKNNIHITVSPRFAVTCSAAMLRQAGEFARANKLILHTHLDKDEGFDELIQSLFSTAHDYFDVFESTQCIADKTVFAHGTLLSLHEMKRMGDYAKQVGISHCPSSNFSFAMGMAPVSFFKGLGIEVGLGSDSGGGDSLSLFDEMRSASFTNKALWRLDKKTALLDAKSWLYHATLGGAKLLGLEKQIGSIEAGKKADLIILDDRNNYPLAELSSLSQELALDELQYRLARVVARSCENKLVAVYIDGKKVYQ